MIQIDLNLHNLIQPFNARSVFRITIFRVFFPLLITLHKCFENLNNTVLCILTIVHKKSHSGSQHGEDGISYLKVWGGIWDKATTPPPASPPSLLPVKYFTWHCQEKLLEWLSGFYQLTANRLLACKNQKSFIPEGTSKIVILGKKTLPNQCTLSCIVS